MGEPVPAQQIEVLQNTVMARFALSHDGERLLIATQEPALIVRDALEWALPWIALGLGVLCLIIAFPLLVRALRRRERRGAPLCRRCGHEVDPERQDACPECVSELTGRRRVRHGRGFVRRAVPVSATLLIGAVLASGYFWAQRLTPVLAREDARSLRLLRFAKWVGADAWADRHSAPYCGVLRLLETDRPGSMRIIATTAWEIRDLVVSEDDALIGFQQGRYAYVADATGNRMRRFDLRPFGTAGTTRCTHFIGFSRDGDECFAAWEDEGGSTGIVRFDVFSGEGTPLPRPDEGFGLGSFRWTCTIPWGDIDRLMIGDVHGNRAGIYNVDENTFETWYRIDAIAYSPPAFLDDGRLALHTALFQHERLVDALTGERADLGTSIKHGLVTGFGKDIRFKGPFVADRAGGLVLRPNSIYGTDKLIGASIDGDPPVDVCAVPVGEMIKDVLLSANGCTLVVTTTLMLKPGVIDTNIYVFDLTRHPDLAPYLLGSGAGIE